MFDDFLLSLTAVKHYSAAEYSKQEDAKSSFFLQNQARTIQTHKTVFENSFLAMFISQVSSKLRDKHCQITRISILIFKHCFMGQYIELVIILPYFGISGLKMMVKSGLGKIFLKFLHAQSLFQKIFFTS